MSAIGTSRFHGVARNLSERLSEAGPAAQRRLALALLAYVHERSELDLLGQALEAVKAARYGDTSLRQLLRAASDDLDDQIGELEERLEDAAEPAPHDEQQLTKLGQIRASYDVGYCALDLDPDTAAQEAAYSAWYATSRQEATALVEVTLREP